MFQTTTQILANTSDIFLRNTAHFNPTCIWFQDNFGWHLFFSSWVSFWRFLDKSIEFTRLKQSHLGSDVAGFGRSPKSSCPENLAKLRTQMTTVDKSIHDILYVYIYIHQHIYLYYIYIYVVFKMVAINQLFIPFFIPPGGVPSTWSTGAQQRRGHGHRVLRGEKPWCFAQKNRGFSWDFNRISMGV